MESESTTCQNLPNFTTESVGYFGGLGFEDRATICGGRHNSNNCYSLVDNDWVATPGMTSGRTYAAVSPSPSTPAELFVTGGQDGEDLNTAEVLTEEGWETLPQPLPVTISAHCQVLLNSTTVLVIGGRQNGNVSSANTHFFNGDSEVWTEGPPLEIARSYHSCGKIRQKSDGNELSVVVVGGTSDGSSTLLSSVEILDYGSSQWRNGPNLPFGIAWSQLVEDPEGGGGVLLVGGHSKQTPFLDSLFELRDAGEDTVWIKRKRKLEKARRAHVAFLVPDNIVDCS